MYIPFFYLIIIAVLFFIQDKNNTRHLLTYIASLVGLFLVSYKYYAIFMYPLFYLVYRATIYKFMRGNFKFLGGNVDNRMYILIAVLLIFLFAVNYFKNNKSLVAIVGIFRKYLPRPASQSRRARRALRSGGPRGSPEACSESLRATTVVRESCS